MGGEGLRKAYKLQRACAHTPLIKIINSVRTPILSRIAASSQLPSLTHVHILSDSTAASLTRASSLFFPRYSFQICNFRSIFITHFRF